MTEPRANDMAIRADFPTGKSNSGKVVFAGHLGTLASFGSNGIGVDLSSDLYQGSRVDGGGEVDDARRGYFPSR
jgi:hypothetical protein